MTTHPHSQPCFVYTGCYTEQLSFVDGRGQGITILTFDPASGGLTPVGEVTGLTNPSYLTLDPRQRFLYAVRETDGSSRDKPAVHAFAVDPATGGLRYLNHQPAGGASPCHVTTDLSGRWVLVANYGAGAVTVYPIHKNGRLGRPTDTVRHQGASVNPERQTGPHAHQIALDPTNRFVFVADLGLDKIMIYRLDPDRGRLVPHEPRFAPLHPGAGPRHLDFHPTGRYVYVLNELDATLVAFVHSDGRLIPIQVVSTLPPGADARPSCAAIRVAPSGRFVYTSNRGHDSIALFAVDDATGRLTSLGHQPTGGQTPREIAIDPSGAFLLAANQDSHTIVTFHIDPDTGQLHPAGPVLQLPSPVCLAFGGPAATFVTAR